MKTLKQSHFVATMALKRDGRITFFSATGIIKEENWFLGTMEGDDILEEHASMPMEGKAMIQRIIDEAIGMDKKIKFIHITPLVAVVMFLEKSISQSNVETIKEDQINMNGVDFNINGTRKVIPIIIYPTVREWDITICGSQL